MANPVYELQEDVYALRVAENEDYENDRYLEIGMLLVYFRSLIMPLFNLIHFMFWILLAQLY